MFGIFLVLCGDNWFVVWLGFELTLICFLPLLAGGLVVVEGMVNYFLVQVGGSSLFVLSFMFPFSFFSNVIFVSGMLLKLGLFPFYRWVPLVMNCFSWVGCLLVVSVQKIAPFFVLCSYVFFDLSYLIFFGVSSVLVGGALGFNQSYMRSLMAYSSISHRGWLVISFVFSVSLFFVYIVLYFCFLYLLFSVFSDLNLNKVFRRMLFSNAGVLVVFLFLSLSGVPPFVVFYLKVYILSFLLNYYYFIPFLILGTMLSVFYYISFVVFVIPSFWWSNFSFSYLGFFVFLLVCFFPVFCFC